MGCSAGDVDLLLEESLRLRLHIPERQEGSQKQTHEYNEQQRTCPALQPSKQCGSISARHSLVKAEIQKAYTREGLCQQPQGLGLAAAGKC